MPFHIRTTFVALAGAFALAAPRLIAAQTPAATAATQTDPRWLGWLGCWAPDSSSSALPNVTCIVPVTGSSAVDALTIVRGKVVVRDRLDANGRFHAIDAQGCKGSETVNWSATGRRVFLHSSYVCTAGVSGTSATIFALEPSGEWLRVEQVRSGGNALVRVDHLRPVSAPAAVPDAVVGAIERQQLAVMAARAAAAAPITSDEVSEAVTRVDSAVVRSWVAASGQELGENTQRSGDAYTNADTYAYPATQPMTMLRRCPPDGCYSQAPYSSYDGYSRYNGYNGYYSPATVYPYSYVPLYYSAPFVQRRNGSDRFRSPVRPSRPPQRAQQRPQQRPQHPTNPPRVGGRRP